jgi:phosphoglycerate dehydrogenase-like enzyme
MEGTVLVTTEWFSEAENHDEVRAKIENAGLTIRLSGHRGILSPEQLHPLLRGARGCIAGIDHFTREVIERADALEVISRTGVGFERIDVDACTERGVIVATSVGSNADAVAEFAIGMMFAAARGIARFDASMRAGKWGSRDVGAVVVGRRLGIVGLGAIGSRLALLARGLRMHVTYYDVVRKPELEADGTARYAPLDEVLSQSDFVSLHTPVTPQTRGMIGERELRLMQPHAYLINTARSAYRRQRARARGRGETSGRSGDRRVRSRTAAVRPSVFSQRAHRRLTAHRGRQRRRAPKKSRPRRRQPARDSGGRASPYDRQSRGGQSVLAGLGQTNVTHSG